MGQLPGVAQHLGIARKLLPSKSSTVSVLRYRPLGSSCRHAPGMSGGARVSRIAQPSHSNPDCRGSRLAICSVLRRIFGLESRLPPCSLLQTASTYNSTQEALQAYNERCWQRLSAGFSQPVHPEMLALLSQSDLCLA